MGRECAGREGLLGKKKKRGGEEEEGGDKKRKGWAEGSTTDREVYGYMYNYVCFCDCK